MIKKYSEFVEESRLGRIMNNSFSDDIRKGDMWNGDENFIISLGQKDRLNVICSLIMSLQTYSLSPARGDKFRQWNVNDEQIWDDFGKYWDIKEEIWYSISENQNTVYNYIKSYKCKTDSEVVIKIYDYLSICCEKYGDKFDKTYFDLREILNRVNYDYKDELDNRPEEKDIYYKYIKESRLGRILNNSFSDSVNKEDDVEAIDLDLPSGTLWAKCNLGAKVPEGLGGFYSWGTLEPDKEHSWNEYIQDKHSDIVKKYSSNNYKKSEKFDMDPEDNVVCVTLGGNWDMPTLDQAYELLEHTNRYWIRNYNDTGIKGVRFESKNDSRKAIFIPASGEILNGNHSSKDDCVVWTKTAQRTTIAGGLYVSHRFKIVSGTANYDTSSIGGMVGLQIRPVLNKKK